MTAKDVIRTCIDHITDMQNDDGSFDSVSIPLAQAVDSNSTFKRKTTYFTSLILESLSAVHNQDYISTIQTICTTSSQFLMSEKSARWTWNYWSRASNEYAQNPLPDDLDDTMCALSALHAFNSNLITPEALAHTSQNLIACESDVGGPYKTWIPARRTLPPPWDDIDIVVNSSVKFFLSKIGINIETLNAHILKKISQNDLHSKYYVSECAINYFILRSIGKSAPDIPLHRICAHFEEVACAEPTLLNLALCLISLIHLDSDRSGLDRIQSNIISTFDATGLQSVQPVCIDPQHGSNRYGASCSAFVASTVIRALYEYEVYTLEHVSNQCIQHTYLEKSANESLIQSLCKEFNFLPHAATQKTRELITGLLEKDFKKEITRTTQEFYACLHKPEDNELERLLPQLTTAHILGWLAYSLYDTMMDESSRCEYLPIANTSYRTSFTYFHLSSDTVFERTTCT